MKKKWLIPSSKKIERSVSYEKECFGAIDFCSIYCWTYN